MVSRRLAITTVLSSTLGLPLLRGGRSANDDRERDSPNGDLTVSAAVSRPPNVPLSVDVAVQRAVITSEQTASLDVAATWHGSETTTLVFGGSAPISVPLYSVPDTPGLVLVASDSLTPADRSDGTHWIPDRSLETPLAARGYEFEPGETVRQRCEVWGAPVDAHAIQPGRYDFRQPCSPMRRTDVTTLRDSPAGPELLDAADEFRIALEVDSTAATQR